MGERQTSFGPFLLRPGRELLRDGKPVPIGHRGLTLLEALVDASGAVVSKAELMERVWPGLAVEDGNLTVQVAALRKELGQRPDNRDWIVTVPRVGYRMELDTGPAAPAPGEEAGPPSLAVMPFINLSGDNTQDYFADGIAEDLITALSRFKTFSVVSRHSSFLYKGRALDVRAVARELGVRYLLEGSMRLAGERVRVTVQLVDAASGTHLWATSVDGALGQIFEFQDRITESVIGLVEPQIRRAEIDRARRRWPTSPKAYDHFLRALPHFYSNDPAGYDLALGHLAQAMTLQPDYALAQAYASWALARKSLITLTHLSADQTRQCLDLARAALVHGSDDPTVMVVGAHSLLAIGHMRAEGLALIERALQDNPNNCTVLVLGGICHMLAGDLDQCEACSLRAYQLSPGAPEAYESLAVVGFARFFKRDFAGAIEWLERSRATLVDWPPTYWMLTAAYAHLGRLDDAHGLLARLLELAPRTSLERLTVMLARSPERMPLLADGLRRAGLPER